MNIGHLVAGGWTRLKLVMTALVLAGVAIGAFAGGTMERALGQAGGTGSTALCAQMSFDTRTDELALPDFDRDVGPGETIASVSHAQNCAGPATATFSAVVTTTAMSAALVRMQATCTGGGCVGGTQVLALPGGATYTALKASINEGGEAHAHTFVFPSLPRGRYTITVEGLATPIVGARVLFRSLVVQGYGPGTPSLP